LFDTTLNDLLEAIDGAFLATVLGYDGIDLGRSVKPSARGQTDHLVVETTALMKRMRKVAAELRMGSVQELSLQAEELILVLRPISDDYVLAVALTPDGNLGMARYQLAAQTPGLRRILER
jgi:predicted regulator of Ras-like GTPase activity (Roadblock/LC7/MglB family)